MAQENITVKLPGCGGEAVIRGYIKNGDRKAVQGIMLASQKFNSDNLADSRGNVTFTIDGTTLTAVTEEQTRRLLISYNGNSMDPYSAMLDSEFQEDMDAVEAAVREVFVAGGSEDNGKKSRAGNQTTFRQSPTTGK